MEPVTVVGAHWQVGSVKLRVSVPPVKFVVSVKAIGVPQTKLGDVLTENGTVLVPLLPTTMSGYGEFGWVIVTPGVLDERTPNTFDAVEHPVLLIVTLRLLHSLASMTPLPLPPEIAAERKAVSAGPVKQVLSVVVAPLV